MTRSKMCFSLGGFVDVFDVDVRWLKHVETNI